MWIVIAFEMAPKEGRGARRLEQGQAETSALDPEEVESVCVYFNRPHGKTAPQPPDRRDPDGR